MHCGLTRQGSESCLKSIELSLSSKFEEIFPNELLLMIFEYLNVYDLFQSFYNMNKRFNNLIHSMSLYHIDLNNIQRKQIFDYYRHSIIPKIQYQQKETTIVLDIDDDLCNCIRILDKIKTMNLKSLKIKNLNGDNINYLVSVLSTFKQLTFLRIQSKADLNSNQFLQLITIPSLKKFQLLFLNYYYPSYRLIESKITTSNIEYLQIRQHFPIQQFQQLLQYLPKLKKLFTYIKSGGYSMSIDNNLHQFVPNLNELKLYVQGLGINDFFLYSKSFLVTYIFSLVTKMSRYRVKHGALYT
ncbi:unnamed protein product [Didymodactylos carnosus]|uniref:F-box domain-containing protein n=1 Tax=Didymodactylos carnosus TaxID=1234261 RepID=A0A8S2DHV2_9BILA|nr:unnamed protein product [Didymodactylos carnosus]CAF3681755.1 unnamed protein product [Didymodactylos carnosus]